MDNGRLDAAEAILADAHSVDAANGDVAAMVTALATARAAVAERERRAEAERQAQLRREAAAAEAERVAEAKRQADRLAEAERQAEAERLAAEAETSQDDAAANAITGNNADAARTFGIADQAVDKSPAQNPPDSGSSAPAQTSVASTAKPALADAARQPVIDSPVAVSSLNRVRYVAPKYPRNAQRRNQSGWVDVVFTVSGDGSVRDIEVRASEPGDVFVNAAIKAVEKWEFEPVLENGVAVEKRAGVRMLFALE